MRRTCVRLPVGTLLYHGTGWPFEPQDIEKASWFSRSASVARRFAERSDGPAPRILAYRTDRELRLPRIGGTADFDTFCDEHAIRPYSAEDMSDGVRRAGLPGWVIPDNYPDGDDILVVDTTTLSFQHEVE